MSSAQLQSAGIADVTCVNVCFVLCRGYSTQTEKDAAKTTKGVRLISLTEFQELLNWGILMGVSHGLQRSVHQAVRLLICVVLYCAVLCCP